MDNLQDIVASMDLVAKNANRAQLETPDHKAAIRLHWDGEAKNWLLTAFEKSKKEAPARGQTRPVLRKRVTRPLPLPKSV